MNYILSIAIGFILCNAYAKSQTADTIEIYPQYVGVHYYYEGKFLKEDKDLEKVLATNPKAYNHFKTASGYETPAIIVGCTGAALVGWPVGVSMSGGQPNWNMAYLGGGILIVAIVLDAFRANHIHKAVKIYNDQARANKKSSSMLDFYVSPNGVGLAYRF